MLSALLLVAFQGSAPSVIPMPNSMQVLKGAFDARSGFVLSAPKEFAGLERHVSDVLGTRVRRSNFDSEPTL
ncbi:MAG TPA: hypothetical protein PKA27_10830, partial [Fimbriimonadaceae bacterium]|nr:hypothetical protein [Fimbriimonadaceae bacterium]